MPSKFPCGRIPMNPRWGPKAFLSRARTTHTVSHPPSQSLPPQAHCSVPDPSARAPWTGVDVETQISLVPDGNRRIPSRSSARRPAASTPKAEGITPPRAASRAGTPRCSSRAGLLIGVAAAVAAARGDRNRMCLPAAAVQQHRGPFFVRPPPRAAASPPASYVCGTAPLSLSVGSVLRLQDRACFSNRVRRELVS